MTRTLTRTATFDAAMAAVARGWSVFPLWPGTKFPALHGEDICPRTGDCTEGHATWEQRATTTPDMIGLAWGKRPYNIGVACKPSRLVVLDFDRPKPGFEWPREWVLPGVVDGADVFTVVCERAGQVPPLDTLTIRTASGGTHLYYAAPDGANLRNTSGTRGCGLGPLIDTRAGGGLVAAPGSIINGRAYTVTHDVAPAPLPGWLATALTPAPLPPLPPPIRLKPGTGDRKERYVSAVIARQVDTIREAASAKTGRNNALYMSAQNLGQLIAGGVMAETRAHADLEAIAVAVGLPIIASRKTIASGFRAGAKRPRTLTEVTA